MANNEQREPEPKPPFAIHPNKMPPRSRSSASFVERHGLWTDEQARAADAVAQAITKRKLELVRFSFADQHGVLRGKTIVAADAPAI